ncbi:MAG: hypothetical protein IPN76_23715 [Saprospiraceae bacterium]|nr:hypothetical protein [Saprospiraceae bacterium]
MKKSIQFLFLLVFLAFANHLMAQAFTTMPEKPVAGEKIKVAYLPKGGPLDGVSFDGVAYIYTSGAN